MNTCLPDSGVLAQQSQLFRYAQDLQELIDQHGKLQQRYQAVLQSQGRSSLSNDLLLSSILHGCTPYLVTDSFGVITEVNASSEPLLGESGLDLRGLQLMQLAPRSQRKNLAALLLQLANNANDAAILQCQFNLFDGREIDSISLFDVLIIPAQNFGQIDYYWLLNACRPGASEPVVALQKFDLFKDSKHGLMATDAKNKICIVNPAFTRITGYERDDVMGRNPNLLSAGRHDGAFYKTFWSALRESGSWSGEFFNRRKDGQIYPDWRTVKAVKNAEGLTLAYLSLFIDSSHQFNETEQLSRLAYQDALTGLPNRRLLEDRMAQALSQAQREGTGLSLLFIDLDRFKPINDTLGHDVGDLALQEVARRLKKSVRQGDTAARVGGDEFVVLLQSADRAEDIKSIANTILSKLSEPIAAREHKLLLGASIGCARYPQDASDIGTLLKLADGAMYSAKRFGGNHICFYDSSGEHTALANLGLDLWHALERNEMHVLYQPQVTAAGELRGCEALLRWNHPSMGAIAPSTFVPIAETNGAILILGDWVLETACRQLRQWQEAGLSAISVSVNVSARQLGDPNFASRVHQTLLSTGVAPQSLELEITETEALRDETYSLNHLKPLRALGVKLAIDDFGTGHSSLSRLKTLPVDRLKIDQSFVHDLATCPNARAISQCFVSMGLAMSMEVVAEGVETQAQHQILTSQGCQLIQGYLTGHPMSPSDLLAQFGQASRQLIK